MPIVLNSDQLGSSEKVCLSASKIARRRCL